MSNDNAKKNAEPQILAGGIYVEENGEATSLLIPKDGNVQEGVQEVKAYREKLAQLRLQQARGKMTEEEVEEQIDAINEDRFGTGGLHTARNRSGATGWREGTQLTKGPDPEHNRDFKGDEFDGIIGYARSSGPGDTRKPAFWSHFTQINEDGTPKLGADGEPLPITHVDQLKGQTFKVCLPDTFPEHLKNNPSIERVADAWGRNPDGSVNKPEDKAITLNERLAEQVHAIAKDSANSGLKVEIVDKPEDAHVIMMGWDNKSPRGLIGFASFPDSMNSWPRLRGLGQPRGKGFLFVNNAYAADPRVSAEELRDLVLHESMRGHNMGGCHPHDLGMLRMSQDEALASTLMSYSTIHGQDFDGTEGSGLGYIDYGVRDWHPNPKPLNTKPGIVYDIQKHMDSSFAKNKDSRSALQSGLLPGAVIINHGEGAELHGTETGNDLLDTNPGYCSIVETPPVREDSTQTLKQKVMLKEGHIAKVVGRGGNNTIIASERGDQVIEPGIGNNTIGFYYHSIGGNKTINSTGNDTLVLSENILLRHQNLTASVSGSDTVIGDDDYKITLQGKGLSNIKVIDANGNAIVEKSVQGLSAEEINTQVLQPAIAEVGSKRHSEHAPHGSFAERYTAEKNQDRGSERAM